MVRVTIKAVFKSKEHLSLFLRDINERTLLDDSIKNYSECDRKVFVEIGYQCHSGAGFDSGTLIIEGFELTENDYGFNFIELKVERDY